MILLTLVFGINGYIICDQIQKQQMNQIRGKSTTKTTDQQTIQDYKEKLHRCFLEMSQLERIYAQQIQTQRITYEEKIKLLQQRNSLLDQKVEDLEKQLSLRYSGEFKDLECSIIQMNKAASQFCQDMVIFEVVKNTGGSQREKIMEAQNKVLRSISNPPAALFSYMDLALQITIENSRLKQELNRYTKIVQTKQEKEKQLNKEIAKIEIQIKNLKSDNERLVEMYREQLQKKTTSLSSLNATTSPKSIDGNKDQKTTQKFKIQTGIFTSSERTKTQKQ